MDNEYEIGTTISGKLIGRDVGKHLFVWIDCPDCGNQRWVQLNTLRGQKKQGQCFACYIETREHGAHWKGGRNLCGRKNHQYIEIWVKEDDFFYPMARHMHGGGGYVKEHRLVMAMHLGRNLHPWEIVHHKGIKYPSGSFENRLDNRLENLQIISEVGHRQITFMQKRIERLTLENRLLKEKLKVITTS